MGIKKTWNITAGIVVLWILVDIEWTLAGSGNDGRQPYGVRAVVDLKKDCIDISGAYVMYGQALPGMPQYYKVGSIPLTLDVMLGQSFPDNERESVTHVQLVQNVATIEIMFWSDTRLVKRTAIKTPSSNVSCDNKRITVQKTVQGRGEATSGAIEIVTKISITNDRALQVVQALSGRARSFFIPYTFQEEYGAQFVKIESKGIKSQSP